MLALRGTFTDIYESEYVYVFVMTFVTSYTPGTIHGKE